MPNFNPRPAAVSAPLGSAPLENAPLESLDFAEPFVMPDGREYALDMRLELTPEVARVLVDATRLDRPNPQCLDPYFADQRFFEVRFLGCGDIDEDAAKILLAFSRQTIAKHLRANAQPTAASRLHTVLEVDLNA